MGAADIFISRKDSLGTWSKPKNLGYPINTYENEEGFHVGTKGILGYFSSDRFEKYNKDLFQFELYTKIRPNPVSYTKGVVYDAKTKYTMSAKVELLNLSNGNSQKVFANQKGAFLVCMQENKDYMLNVSKKGYLFYSDQFLLNGKNIQDTSFYIEVPLTPIQKGKKIVLKNVFFALDSYQLKKESYFELDKLVAFLKINNKVSIEIGGHTDNTGSTSHNQVLSENRANAVAEYLINKGISQTRVKYKGYGAREPIAPNNTLKGRALNRRTEAKVVS